MSPTTATETRAAALENDNTVLADFNYWGATSLPDLSDFYEILNGSSQRLRSVRCKVYDIRACGLPAFSLSTHAFQILQHSSSLLPPQSASIPDFHDQTLMKSTYWPELTSLLKSQLGVRSAVAINTSVRDVSQIGKGEFNPNNPRANPKQSLAPFFFVHGDYTPGGARAHMRAVLPTFFEDNGCVESTAAWERGEFFKLRDEIVQAEEEGMKLEGVTDQWLWSGKNYAGPRWAILSVWRPLDSVHRDPLAIMDPRTLFKQGVERKPYAPFERTYKDRPGFVKEYTSANMLPITPETGDEHRWYYISNQKPEELYALKLFDSEAHKQGSDVAECSAHSAFSLPEQENEEPRRSAEVRVMVIW